MDGKRALVIVFGLVTVLGGCGAVDSGVTFLPEGFRQPAPRLAEIEQPTDVHLIVRNNISAIFMAGASPSNISVSFPVAAKYGGCPSGFRVFEMRGVEMRLGLGKNAYCFECA